MPEEIKAEYRVLADSVTVPVETVTGNRDDIIYLTDEQADPLLANGTIELLLPESEEDSNDEQGSEDKDESSDEEGKSEALE